MERVVFSGIQSTGALHLGNYLGAVRNWVALQARPLRRYYAVVDHHAITARLRRTHDQITFDTSLSAETRDLTATLLACGIDPVRSCLFLQSLVPEHLELYWILGAITPFRLMNNMTQFKSKSADQERLFGLFAYPLLMAADILLYRADLVPIGEDQVQHLQLTQDVAERANKLLGLGLPRPQYQLATAFRVMSLKDGAVKMSKSDPSDLSRINLSDSPDTIRAKIKKAKTDSLPGIAMAPDRPQLSNLLRLYLSLKGLREQHWNQAAQGLTKQAMKEQLAELLVNQVAPFQLRFQQLRKDQPTLKRTLQQGSQQARATAAQNLRQIKSKVGYFM